MLISPWVDFAHMLLYRPDVSCADPGPQLSPLSPSRVYEYLLAGRGTSASLARRCSTDSHGQRRDMQRNAEEEPCLIKEKFQREFSGQKEEKTKGKQDQVNRGPLPLLPGPT